MGYQVLARKLRPKKFEEVLGQEHITRSLQNSILNKTVGQAYLLTGTRGIGKTTVARIFAKALRCPNKDEKANPCLQCDSCLQVDNSSSVDVIEIDGASNNGVESIRQLVENVMYLPTNGEYKVYIIDEVHMLSTSAFNALLKTLEEPPAHVVFILATTDPQKLLGTVLSRCQRLDFKNASLDELTSHLTKVSKQENLKFRNERQIKSIAQLADGSFRDALSLMDQVLSYAAEGEVSDEVLSSALGIAKLSTINKLINSILKDDKKTLSDTYHLLLEENIPPKKIGRGILDGIFYIIENLDARDALAAQEGLEFEVVSEMSVPELFWLYETLAKDIIWILDSLDPAQTLLICLNKLALRRSFFLTNSKKISENLADISTTKLGDNKPTEALEIEAKETKEEVKEEIQEAPKVETREEPKEGPKEEPKAEIKVQDKKNKTWEGFLDFLTGESPVLGSTLEQGNLTSPIGKTLENLSIEIGFKPSTKVFYETLSEKESRVKLIKFLSQYFNTPETNIHLSMSVIEPNDKRFSNFSTRAEEVIKSEEEEEEKLKQGLLENPVIKEAELAFSGKVDKIVIHNKRG